MLTVSGLLAVAAVAFTLAPTKQPSAYRSSYTMPEPAQHIAALFVGDMYLSGAAGVSSARTFAPLTCTSLSWVCNLDGQDGTGYQSRGLERNLANRQYAGRLPDDKAKYLADVVVVTGGQADRGLSGEYQAVAKYLAALEVAFPKRTIVVVEPFWIGTEPSRDVASLRSDVRRAAAATGAVWIPTQDWLAEELASKDGVHLSDQGHAALAARLTTALRKVAVPTRSA